MSIEPDWIDYGDWKDWHSPWGQIAIEQCSPTITDRGRVAIKTLTDGAVNLLFNPFLSNAYFFDELRAEQHIIAITCLAQILTEDELRSLELEERGEPQIFPGRDVECRLTTLLLRPILIPVTKFDVEVKTSKKDTHFLDYADMFPRLYIDREIAQAEVIAWMEARGQLM